MNWKEILEKSDFNIFELDSSILLVTFQLKIAKLVIYLDQFPIIQQQIPKDLGQLKKLVIEEIDNGDGNWFSQITIENKDEHEILMDEKNLFNDPIRPTSSINYKTYRDLVKLAIIKS